MSDPNTLGEYLRARRELVHPADAGLPATGVRRTPGLRREEVATLAGFSADYYLRLEQGRDRNPSPQVLDALAGVLGLDPTAREYLLGLAAVRPRPARRPRREVVPAGIRQLLDVIGLPAFVESRIFDVLAANRLATALLPAIRPGENRMRSVFLDEGERAALPDWDKAIGGMVAAFRASLGTPATRGSPSSSASCPWPASRSAGSGPGTTSSRWPASRPGSCTRRSGCWSCAGRSCLSATRAGSCWCCITRNRARTARGRWRCSARWPPPAPARIRPQCQTRTAAAESRLVSRGTLEAEAAALAAGSGGSVNAILNVIWLVLEGIWMALGYVIAGLVCFVLIITIPFGIAAFRIAGYVLWPFGRTVEPRPTAGVGSLIGNILWIILFGWWLALGHLIAGVALCLTIIGIPLGLASFKIIPVTLMPLGVRIIPTSERFAGPGTSGRAGY